MKTIIIPTDLSINSLDLVKNAVLNYPNEIINIVLSYGHEMRLSDFQPMNFLSSRNFKSNINENFINLKQKLFQEHKNQIGKINVEAFTGMNSFAFANFLEAHQISEALIPETAQNSFPSREYFDISDLIRENMQKVIEVKTRKKDLRQKDCKLTVTSISKKVNFLEN